MLAMLYRFKSKATGDLIMLQPHGHQLLQIMGKDTDPVSGKSGILLVAQMAAARRALLAAIDADDKARNGANPAPATSGTAPASEGSSDSDDVALRQRAKPFLDMLQRCQDEGRDIVWGV